MTPTSLAHLHQVFDHWEAAGAPVAPADEAPAETRLLALQALGERIYGRRPAAEVLRQACATLDQALITVPLVEEAPPPTVTALPQGWWGRQCRRLALRHQCRLPVALAQTTWGEPGLQACVATGTGSLFALWGGGGLVSLLPMAVVHTPGWVLGTLAVVFTGVLGKSVLAFMTARGLKDLSLRQPQAPAKKDWWMFYSQVIETHLAEERAAAP